MSSKEKQNGELQMLLAEVVLKMQRLLAHHDSVRCELNRTRMYAVAAAAIAAWLLSNGR